MKRIVVLALLVTAFAFAPARQAAAQDSKIGVANLSRIIQSMQEAQDRNKAKGDEVRRLDEEQKAKAMALDNLKKERENFKKDSPEYKERSEQLLQKSIEFQAWNDLKKVDLTRRQKDEVKSFYDKINAAIQQIATEKKLDVVLADFSVDIPDLDQINPEQLQTIIRQKQVLFTAKGVDISDDVINRLNAQYKAAGK
jgi:Skp family chaperone for outer membrane proteins